MWVRSLSQEEPLEEGVTTHSSILAWRISWTEEPGGLQSMGSQRAGHDEVSVAQHSIQYIQPLARCCKCIFINLERY